ncbi:hypothetical protein ACWEQ3_01380 [Streptomyces mirabilis]
MAKLDASIAERNVASAIADRTDAYRIAVRLLRDSGFDAEAEDALYLAQFLAGQDV